MKGFVCFAISAPVRAQMTPGTASAAAVSRPVNFACAYGERTNFRYSILRSLMSSMNLPRPRRSRLSSFRASPLPTQPPPLVPALKSVQSSVSRPNLSLTKCCLQAINQLLYILFSERLEQPARNGSQAPKNLCFALPGNPRTNTGGSKIETCCQGDVPARDAPLSLILGANRTVCFGKLHFYIRGALDVGDAYVHLHRKMTLILNVHALKVRQ